MKTVRKPWLLNQRKANLSRRISLTQKKSTLVDDADFKWLNQWKWHARHDGNTWYASRQLPRISGRQFNVKMHREILGLTRGDGKQCDHVDGNGLNNRRSNLRICTKHQNSFNRKPTIGTSSKFKGVYWEKSRCRWHAQIKQKNRTVYLGRFDSEVEAGLAYNVKALEFFGEFAKLNEIGD